MTVHRSRRLTSTGRQQQGVDSQIQSTRRMFLKGAGAVAGTALIGDFAWPPPTSARTHAKSVLQRTNPGFVITPDEARQWAVFKAGLGPTYAGAAGWKRYTDFLISKMTEYGVVDFDYIDIPYDRFVVEDWPDRRTHIYDSGMAVEKLVSDGTPVAVVASYGMTSGFTPPEGITAPMLYYDRAHPPDDAQIAGKILVFDSAPYPDPPYSDSFLDSYTLTDYEWRSPGQWHPLFTPVPQNVASSFHSRWVWGQLNQQAAIAIKGRAAGMVSVYDLSPGASLGLTQRSVYTKDGKAGLGATYVNCPTLTLDRVHGAKVLADAKSGKMATLVLIARFQRETGRACVAFLPGKNYGKDSDEQIVVATHTDAMSLVEENGGLGILGILSYFKHIPRSARPRTLLLYLDCRHFMPGGESAWPEYDYFSIHPERTRSVVATLGLEHLGGRQTIETGSGNNEYKYSTELPENGGVITSLIDVYNNNIWMVETIAKAATDNRWPRVDVKAGNVEPGVNGGFQGSVKSNVRLMKIRTTRIPAIELAADWPGAWTQTYAQLDTEAGPHGFDPNYFVQQVAGLSQIAGELMLVGPVVIDLGWGETKSAVVKLKNSDFNDPSRAEATRQGLVKRYTDAFRKAEVGDMNGAKAGLQALTADVTAAVVSTSQQEIKTLIDRQFLKLG